MSSTFFSSTRALTMHRTRMHAHNLKYIDSPCLALHYLRLHAGLECVLISEERKGLTV